MDGLVAQLEPWLADPLDAEPRELARIVADHHRAGWRLRHQTLRDGEVDCLVRAWREGGPACFDPADPEVAPAPAVRWSQGMLGLVRRRILAPGTWRDLTHCRTSWWGARISPGDVALVDGDAKAALTLYAESLQADSSDQDAWTGLGLALGELGSDEAALALRERPELVRAVFQALAGSGAAPDPQQVAQWLGAALCRPRHQSPCS